MAITTKPASIGEASGDDAPVATSVAALITDAPVPHPTLWEDDSSRDDGARSSACSAGTHAVHLHQGGPAALLLFAFVFAYVMPKIGSGFSVASTGSTSTGGTGAGSINFATILVPGLMGSMFLMQGMFGTTMPLIMEFSWQRTIEDRALAPVPIRVLGIQKITAGAIQAFIGASIVFPVVYWVHAPGQGPHVHVSNWLLLAVVMVFSSTLTASLGLWLGTVVDPRKIQMIFAVILLPITMLGCVYYPWSALHAIRWLQIVTLINPMVYMTEGLRAALTPGIGHMALWAIMLALVGGTLAFGSMAVRTFRNRVVN